MSARVSITDLADLGGLDWPDGDPRASTDSLDFGGSSLLDHHGTMLVMLMQCSRRLCDNCLVTQSKCCVLSGCMLNCDTGSSYRLGDTIGRSGRCEVAPRVSSPSVARTR